MMILFWACYRLRKLRHCRASIAIGTLYLSVSLRGCRSHPSEHLTNTILVFEKTSGRIENYFRCRERYNYRNNLLISRILL